MAIPKCSHVTIFLYVDAGSVYSSSKLFLMRLIGHQSLRSFKLRSSPNQI